MDGGRKDSSSNGQYLFNDSKNIKVKDFIIKEAFTMLRGGKI